MGATDNLRKQHAELVEMAQSIASLFDPAKLATGAGEMRRMVSALLGKLTMYLAVEDNVLYPRLEKHTDARIRETVKKFAAEMAGMKLSVDEFGRKWTEREIRGNAAGFRAAAKKLLAALEDRIKRENMQFYALVDQAA